MRSLETIVAVTHTRVFVSELIARNSKTFIVPKKRNLNYDQDPSLVLI